MALSRGIRSQDSQNLGSGKGVKKSLQSIGNGSRKFVLQEWSEIETQKIETYPLSTHASLFPLFKTDLSAGESIWRVIVSPCDEKHLRIRVFHKSPTFEFCSALLRSGVGTIWRAQETTFRVIDP